MKKNLVFIFLFFVVAKNIFAQTANYSLPQKNSKRYDYAVLGKTTEGIIIYKYTKYESIIECYDVAMNLKWTRNAEMETKNNTIEHISVHNNQLCIFFSYKRNGFVILSAQLFSPKLEPIGINVAVDSIASDKAVDLDWYVKHSEDKRYYMAYYVKAASTTQTTLQTILLNDKLRIVKKKSVDIPETKKEMVDELMDNEGNFYFFVADQERVNGNPKVVFAHPRFYSLKKNEAISEVHNLCNATRKFNSLNAKIDNINRAFLIAGIAKDKLSTKETPGFHVSKWLLDRDSLAVCQLETFTDNMVKEMMLVPETDVSNYEITDMVVRFDGGLILIAENTYNTTQTVEIPNYYSPAFPTIRTYTYLHKDDLFVQAFNTNGEAQWHQLIRKKQTSENDAGFYSSYGLLKGKNSIRLVYNETIEEQADLVSHTIKANGSITRNSIYGSRQKNLFLAPKKASQVSLYEVLIPSENRGYLQFMKIDF